MIGPMPLNAWYREEVQAHSFLPGLDKLEEYASLWGSEEKTGAPQPSAGTALQLPLSIEEETVLVRDVSIPVSPDLHVFLFLPPIPCPFTLSVNDTPALSGDGSPFPDTLDLSALLYAQSSCHFRLTLSPFSSFILYPFQLHFSLQARIAACPSSLHGNQLLLSPCLETDTSFSGYLSVSLLSGGKISKTRSYPVSLAPGKNTFSCFFSEIETDTYLSLSLFSGTPDKPGTLNSRLTLPLFPPAPQCRAYFPLSPENLQDQAFLDSLTALHLCAVGLSGPVPETAALSLSQQGIRLFYPKALLPGNPVSASLASGVIPENTPELDRTLCAYLLMNFCSSAPALPPDLSWPAISHAMCGRHVDQSAAEPVLELLSLLYLRLRAESARQGKAIGPIWQTCPSLDPAVLFQLSSAFAPIHLSVSPLRGAWYTESRFSVSLMLFGEGTYSVSISLNRDNVPLFGQRFDAVPGPLPSFSCPLPKTPGRLSLQWTLAQNGKCIEQGELPVFTGTYAPLESAFASIASAPPEIAALSASCN